MQKITITVDVTQIDKSRIIDREITLQDGTKRIAKEVKFDVVELKEKKEITSGDTWVLNKTHFVTMSPTKEERAAKVKTAIVGDGVQFGDKNPSEEQPQYPTEDITPEDIPF